MIPMSFPPPNANSVDQDVAACPRADASGDLTRARPTVAPRPIPYCYGWRTMILSPSRTRWVCLLFAPFLPLLPQSRTQTVSPLLMLL